MADSLRKGEGSPRFSRRARSSRQKEARRQSQGQIGEGDLGFLSQQQTREVGPEGLEEVGDGEVRKEGRLRSMSETLGRMMTSKGKERDRGGGSRRDEGEALS